MWDESEGSEPSCLCLRFLLSEGIAGGLFHCSQAHLLAAPQVRTYTVLSITSSLGMVEFVGGTQSLKQAIMHPSLITSEVRGSLTRHHLPVTLCPFLI